MKIKFLVIFTVIGLGCAYGQPIKTLFHKDSTKIKSFKGYGEMFVKGTQLKSQLFAVIGGRGGFMFNRKIAFGGVGAGYLTPSGFKGDNLAGNPAADLNLKMGSGGIFFEYIHKIESLVHFSIPLSFIIGNVEVTDDTGARIEGSRVLMIEPGVNIEFNFSKILIISLTGSYRIAKVNTLTNLNNQDMSGFVIGLVGKFGSF
jgi:hypothetical protein